MAQYLSIPNYSEVEQRSDFITEPRTLREAVVIVRDTAARCKSTTVSEKKQKDFVPTYPFAKSTNGLNRNPCTYGCRLNPVKEIVNKVVDENQHCIILGGVQMGKTEYIRKVAEYITLHTDYNVNIILDNFNVQKNSFLERFKRDMDYYASKFNLKESESVSKLSKYMYNSFIDNDGTNVNGSKIRVSICNIKPLRELQNANQWSNYIILADESDVTAVNSIKERTERGKCVNELMLDDGCKGSVRVSATIYAHLICESTVPVLCKNILFFSIPRDYIDYKKSEVCNIKPLENGLSFHLPRESVFNTVQKRTLRRIINKRITYLRSIDQIPVFLFLISRNVKQQTHLKKVLERSKGFGSKMITILINNGKIKVNHKKIQSIITANKDITLQGVMTLIQKLDDIKERTVSIIGGAMIGRGQSPRSEVSNFKSYKDILFAQTSFVCTSNTTCVDSIVQNMGRVFGLFPKWKDEITDRLDSNFPKLEIYTSQNEANNFYSIMDWNQKCIEFITDPKNANKVVREHLKPIDTTEFFDVENSRDKLRKMSSKAPPYKRDGNELYPTEESFVNGRDTEIRNNNFVIKEGTIVHKILEFLKDNNSYTVKEIYNSNSNWNISENSKTPMNTISSRVIELFEAGKLSRRKNNNNIYEYKIKN